MIDIHVEAHADGVGGDQKIHLARLIEGDLGVAGPGRERTHHHRGAAALAADQFGDGVDIVGREGDHGGAPGQAGQFLRTGIGQAGKPLAGHKFSVGQQPPDQGSHGRRAQKQGLIPPARVQKAVGEDVAAFRVSAELDLVHRQEFDVAAERHGLDRADKIDRTRRNDLFFAGDQGDGPGAAQLDHPVIDLARQKS